MSYWDHRKPVQRARAVDVDAVARTAVALLDDGGLPGLSLRGVAQRLDVAPTSLYSRVESVDDLFDLALDHALGADERVHRAVASAALPELMLVYFRHLVAHRWAGQVIAMRAPRGPHYLQLSERMVVLLDKAGVRDALGAAYQLSNLVIGSAMTAPMAGDERARPIDVELAPVYAQLHSKHDVDPEALVREGIAAILREHNDGHRSE